MILNRFSELRADSQEAAVSDFRKEVASRSQTDLREKNLISQQTRFVKDQRQKASNEFTKSFVNNSNVIINVAGKSQKAAKNAQLKHDLKTSIH